MTFPCLSDQKSTKELPGWVQAAGELHTPHGGAGTIKTPSYKDALCLQPLQQEKRPQAWRAKNPQTSGAIPASRVPSWRRWHRLPRPRPRDIFSPLSLFQLMQQQAAIMASVAQGGYLNPMAAFAAAQMQQMAALNMNGLAAAPMTPTSGKGTAACRGQWAGKSNHVPQGASRGLLAL